MKRHIIFSTLLATLVVAVAGNYSLAWAADAAAGKGIYEAKCLVCHGATGAGDGPMGAMLKPKPADFSAQGFLSSKSDADLLKTIKEGKGGIMPGFKDMSDAEISNIIAYIRTLGAKK